MPCGIASMGGSDRDLLALEKDLARRGALRRPEQGFPRISVRPPPTRPNRTPSTSPSAHVEGGVPEQGAARQALDPQASPGPVRPPAVFAAQVDRRGRIISCVISSSFRLRAVSSVPRYAPSRRIVMRSVILKSLPFRCRDVDDTHLIRPCAFEVRDHVEQHDLLRIGQRGGRFVEDRRPWPRPSARGDLDQSAGSRSTGRPTRVRALNPTLSFRRISSVRA